MALVVKDRVKETTATTGTGTITLAGAATGFQSFSVIGDNNTTYYAIESGSDWEVGIGTYTASGTTLSRDTILESSNAGSAISLSGTSTVFCTYPAERSVNTADIGSTVQAYDADTAKYDDTTANFTGTLQNGGSNVVVDTDIGSTVQGYDINTAKYDDATANFTGNLQKSGANVLTANQTITLSGDVTGSGSTSITTTVGNDSHSHTTSTLSGNVSAFTNDSGYLTSSAIGSTVQAYDADTAKYDDTTANFTGTLQNGGSNVIVDSDINSTVLGYVAPSTSGNVLTSNGTTWTSAVPTGGGGGYTIETSTATSNVTLTNANDNYQVITITDSDCELITLPDATTMSVGDYFVFDFPQGKPQRICRSGDGDFGFIPEENKPIVLLDNSTSAGVWSFFPDNIIYKNPINPSEFSNSTSADMFTLWLTGHLDIKRMSDDIILVVWRLAANEDIYGVCYNITTNTWGSTTLIDSILDGTSKVHIVPLTTTKAFLVCISNGSISPVAITLSGTTITAGATGTTRAIDYILDYFVYDSSTVLVMATNPADLRFFIYDVNGTTVTESLNLALPNDTSSSTDTFRRLQGKMCVDSNYVYVSAYDGTATGNTRPSLYIIEITGSSGSYGGTLSDYLDITTPSVGQIKQDSSNDFNIIGVERYPGLCILKEPGSSGTVYLVSINSPQVFGGYSVTISGYSTIGTTTILTHTNIPYTYRFEDGVKVADNPKYIMHCDDFLKDNWTESVAYPFISSYYGMELSQLSAYLGNPLIRANPSDYAFIGTFEFKSATDGVREDYFKFNIEKVIYIPFKSQYLVYSYQTTQNINTESYNHRKSVVSDYIIDSYSGLMWKEI